MRRAVVLLALLAVTAAAAATAQADPAGGLQATQVGRMPFPERGYVLDVPAGAALDLRTVHVTEDGRPVAGVSLRPLAGSGLRYGVVLALDTSESMVGAPYAAALGAARSFVGRQAEGEQIALLAFNGSLHLMHGPTLDGAALMKSLAHPPALAYGTRIVDALDASLTLLARQKAAAGAVVLLSDGSDVGSVGSLSRVVARARARHVRVFTVGLESQAFDGVSLRSIAEQTGGAYAVAASASELGPIYEALGQRLATSYLLQYRSNARPKTTVAVRISADRIGAARLGYRVPAASLLAPYHRSLAARFLLSWASLALLGIVGAALAGWCLHLVLERRRPQVVRRIEAFASGDERRTRPMRSRRSAPSPAAGAGRLARLERDFDIARIEVSAGRAVLATAAVTAVTAVILGVVSPVLCLLAALVPLGARAIVSHKVRRVREAFAEQLAPNLQVLASALRAGHSFLGAVSSSVENAEEPSRTELGRIVADERLGVPVDEAIRRVALRMESRDLEQVALLAELARTTGGNSAEVLDVVVGTIRERADVRRLVRTLTAQGRMARWILTVLPVATGLGFYALQPGLVGPMVHSVFGQVLLVLAAAMVVAGSAVIQRLVEIEI